MRNNRHPVPIGDDGKEEEIKPEVKIIKLKGVIEALKKKEKKKENVD